MLPSEAGGGGEMVGGEDTPFTVRSLRLVIEEWGWSGGAGGLGTIGSSPGGDVWFPQPAWALLSSVSQTFLHQPALCISSSFFQKCLEDGVEALSFFPLLTRPARCVLLNVPISVPCFSPFDAEFESRCPTGRGAPQRLSQWAVSGLATALPVPVEAWPSRPTCPSTPWPPPWGCRVQQAGEDHPDVA